MVLVEVASLLSASVRSADVAARLGGDEFALLLDDLELGAAEQRAQAIVRGVADRSWSHVQAGLGVRVSVGFAAGHPVAPDDLYGERTWPLPGEDGRRLALDGGALRGVALKGLAPNGVELKSSEKPAPQTT